MVAGKPLVSAAQRYEANDFSDLARSAKGRFNGGHSPWLLGDCFGFASGDRSASADMPAPRMLLPTLPLMPVVS
jgi:hypothetical protein